RNASIQPKASRLAAPRGRAYCVLMGDTDMLSNVASLLGEPARTRILTALLTGRALTAKELAYFAGVTAATASSHLSRLVAGQLLGIEEAGRGPLHQLPSP